MFRRKRQHGHEVKKADLRRVFYWGVLLTSWTRQMVDLIHFCSLKTILNRRELSTLHRLQRPVMLHQFRETEALPNRQIVPKYSVHALLYQPRERAIFTIYFLHDSYIDSQSNLAI
jgi:hypothetical protein